MPDLPDLLAFPSFGMLGTKLDGAPKSGNSADGKQHRKAAGRVPERADSLRIEPLMLRPRVQHVIYYLANMTRSFCEIPLGEGIAAIPIVIARVGYCGYDEPGRCQRNRRIVVCRERLACAVRHDDQRQPIARNRSVCRDLLAIEFQRALQRW